MDALLDSLGRLFLQAVPTFVLLVLLHLYLRAVFYGPLDKVLRERHDATEGARQAAQESLDRAERRAAEYEAALRSARAELYARQEETRHRVRAEQAAALAEARRIAASRVREARDQVLRDASEARAGLEAQSEALAEEITAALLERRAS
jgi:F-type H+-transporting ATPase subunit b